MTTRTAAFPLRAALSVPAIVALVLQQVGRFASPSPLLWFALFEIAFVSAAFLVARRSPQASWAWVPVMWAGAGIGALVDAWVLGGPKDGVLPLMGLAAPALAIGFALARSVPQRSGSAVNTAPPPERGQDQ